MMRTITRAKENAFAWEINHEFPEFAAILDSKMGVLIYPKEAVEEGCDAGWLIAVSGEDESIGEVMKYNFDRDIAAGISDDDINRLADKIIEFIYGGGKYATKQLTTA